MPGDWPYHDEMPEGRLARQKEVIGGLPFFNLIGLKFEESRKDFVRLSLEARKDLAQPAGLLHGGMHATLVDTAVAQALVTTLKSDYDIVTIHLDTKYFKPLLKGKIYAEGRIVRKGKRVAHGDVALLDAEGNLLGKGWCVYAILERKE